MFCGFFKNQIISFRDSRTHRKEKALKFNNFRAFSLSPLYTMASPNSG